MPGRAVGASGDAVVGDLEHERAVAQLGADADARRLGVLGGVADRLGEHRLGERLERLGHRDARRPRPRCRASGYSWREARDLLGERRAGRGRGAAERALHRGAQVAERLLDLLGAAPPRLLVEGLVAGERERDAEQALDDALVDLAGEVDALLERDGALVLARRRARHRRQRRHLAEDPQHLALGGGQRRAVAAAVAEDRAEPAPARGDRRADDGARLQALDVAGGELLLEVLAELDARGPARAPRARAPPTRA